MPHLLTLRGRNALSPFRVAKLLAAISASHPHLAVAGISAVYWHFVDTVRALDPPERLTLERILSYGPHDDAVTDAGHFRLVVPRPGTISPWSSKATDIAHNCGLEAIKRMSPQQRLIKPEEVAALALLLASEDGGGINGQAINVDGGAVLF